jgi:hypothetical protein
VLDSDWEAEFCRVAKSHPKVRAYVKNHNLGLEVPYRYGSQMRKYLPDFIVLVDDGHGDDDLLHLIVEIKGYRREDAKEKKATMETYWVPGVNHLKAASTSTRRNGLWCSVSMKRGRTGTGRRDLCADLRSKEAADRHRAGQGRTVREGPRP